MKKTLILITALATIIYGCAKEEEFVYDASSVVPVVQDFSGPSSATANGFGENEYSVRTRGGSSFAFSVVGTDATVTAVADAPHKSNVVFAQSSVDLTAYVIVVETAANGKSSEADSIMVSLAAYCAFNPSDFAGGTASGVEPCWDLDFGGTVPIVVDGSNITFPADASGNPTIFNGKYAGWGETFQAGFGNEGAVTGTMNEDGTIEFAPQYIGQTLPGPYDYWFQASGSYDQCKKTITLQTWDWSYDEFASAWYGSASGCEDSWTISVQ